MSDTRRYYSALLIPKSNLLQANEISQELHDIFSQI